MVGGRGVFAKPKKQFLGEEIINNKMIFLRILAKRNICPRREKKRFPPELHVKKDLHQSCMS